MPSSSPSRHLSKYVGIDGRKLLFAWSNFLAAAATLIISFEASLPRPWWALLTVYVTAQPMSGAFRPKMLYRFGGIAVGAIMTILLVPNLQNSPILLVFCLAVWTGFCIYLAVLDRTPRAFLFQMAAFSAAVMSFPYLDDPQDIFTTTISRVEEMSVAIMCVTLMHSLLQPWSVRPIIRERAQSFLAHMSGWTAETLGRRHTGIEYEHRRRLAADVVELGMIAVHLPFDQRFALATRETVLDLQHDMAAVLPIASAVANRLERLRALSAVDTELETLVGDVAGWLEAHPDEDGAEGVALMDRCRRVSAERLVLGDWPALLAASLCDRMAALLEVVANARGLVARFDDEDAVVERRDEAARQAPRFALARDHGLSALAGAATAVAICLYCAVWILLAWPNGSATAAFAALITCSFAAQDDPAPVIGRYLLATLITFPLAALYLFVLLPRVDGAGVLILVLAPALLWMGYIQADASRSAQALPMFSCFIVAMGFLDRFQADFALFANTGLAQVGGIVATLTVTRLFRSANIRWTAHRIIRANWRDLEALANPRQPLAAETWTARAVDRLGQIAARMAEASPGDALHAADGLDDLRIGRNLIQIQQSTRRRAGIREPVTRLFTEVEALFRARLRAGHPLPAPTGLLAAIDATMSAAAAHASVRNRRLMLALVGMRCNLFPSAVGFRVSAE